MERALWGWILQSCPFLITGTKRNDTSRCDWTPNSVSHFVICCCALFKAVSQYVQIGVMPKNRTACDTGKTSTYIPAKICTCIIPCYFTSQTHYFYCQLVRNTHVHTKERMWNYIIWPVSYLKCILLDWYDDSSRALSLLNHAKNLFFLYL